MSAVRGGRKTADGPLYVQVRDLLMKEIHTGAWMPGEMLPNEFELAAAFGVSQGTMRKALDSLAREHVLVRRQGIGTFVSEHTPAEVLFRFFQFRDQQGRRVIPESRTLRTTVAPVTCLRGAPWRCASAAALQPR